jgi:hypothetical protein
MRYCIASSTTSRLKDQHNQGFVGTPMAARPNDPQLRHVGCVWCLDPMRTKVEHLVGGQACCGEGVASSTISQSLWFALEWYVVIYAGHMRFRRRSSPKAKVLESSALIVVATAIRSRRPRASSTQSVESGPPIRDPKGGPSVRFEPLAQRKTPRASVYLRREIRVCHKQTIFACGFHWRNWPFDWY